MMELSCMAITAYILTRLITGATVLESFRMTFKKWTPWLNKAESHFIDCRLCVGFWVSIAVVCVAEQYAMFLPVYGMSYFLATQERR